MTRIRDNGSGGAGRMQIRSEISPRHWVRRGLEVLIPEEELHLPDKMGDNKRGVCMLKNY